MLYAALKEAPVHGGRLVDVDLSPVRSMPGVVQVVRLERAVAVVAQSWWQAWQAVDALEPQFSTGDKPLMSSADIAAEQDRVLAAGDGTEMVAIGDAGRVLSQADAAKIVEAEYRVPYLHQAAMEPLNITAQFVDGHLTVWGGEQDALGSKARLMEISGLGSDAVTLHGLPAGGSLRPPERRFGRLFRSSGAAGNCDGTEAGEADLQS